MGVILDGRGVWAAAMAAWLAGAAWQLQQAQLMPPALAWAGCGAAMAVLVGVGLIVARGAPFGRGLTLTLALALAVAGAVSTDLRAGQRLAERLDPTLETRDLVVTGTVAELPRLQAQGTRFVLEVESARDASGPVRVPSRLSLGWYPGFDGATPLSPWPRPLLAGDRWELPVRLKAVHGSLNPHGFDFELWMFEEGIGGSGSVRAGAKWLAATGRHPVERARQQVRDRVLVQVADPAAAGVLAALAVGDQAAIPAAGWELFRDAGIAHLMSISGLHVTMFAWMAALGVGRAWRRVPGLALRWPAVSAARWAGLACALAYALLAGWGVPAQRTVGMLAVVVALRAAGLRWPPLLVLGAAGTAVVAADPWALLQPGFWLSFFAVALLFGAEPGGSDPAQPAIGWRATLRSALRTQWVATVGLAPLTLAFFQQLSVVGFVANLVAIPLVTAVITPLALAGVVIAWLWQPAAWGVQALSWVLEAAVQWPWAVWTAAAAPAWAVAAGVAGGALAVAPLPLRLRLLAVPLVLPLLWPAMPRPAQGAFEVVAADVGQGTAVLVRTASHLMVYDAGPVYSPEADAGQRVVLPLLRARGERRIDRLVLSHQDADHVGGAASLLRGIEVVSSLSSLGAAHPLAAMLPAHQPCRAGQRWDWDGVRFEVLHPADADVQQAEAARSRPNAVSCVVRVTGADGRRALLTGDIEAAQEEALLRREGAALASHLLLTPHHGSRTSSTAGFLQAVRPEVSVVQAGYLNRYGHPAPDVVQRHADLGVPLVRTEACGAYTWPQGLCERREARRYWHHRVAAHARAPGPP